MFFFCSALDIIVYICRHHPPCVYFVLHLKKENESVKIHSKRRFHSYSSFGLRLWI